MQFPGNTVVQDNNEKYTKLDQVLPSAFAAPPGILAHSMATDAPSPPYSPALPAVSLIVPTYREAESLPVLLARVDAVRQAHGMTLEALIMDDDSQDGTTDVIDSLHFPWVTLVTRTENRGLSPAVIDGFRRAKHSVFVVMDADLSHPPEKIPELVEAVAGGADFALGSRYVPGGETEEGWGLFRWLNSRLAVLLARPLTTLRDPMSGFFAIPRDVFERAEPNLNPIGYKIGLEVLVKGRCENVFETPIRFANRQAGESKLTLAEQVRYVRHLVRLYRFVLTRRGG